MSKGNSVGSDCHDEPRLHPGKLEAARQHRNDHRPRDGVEHGIEALNRPARSQVAPPLFLLNSSKHRGLRAERLCECPDLKVKARSDERAFLLIFPCLSRIADSGYSICKSSFHHLSFEMRSLQVVLSVLLLTGQTRAPFGLQRFLSSSMPSTAMKIAAPPWMKT